MRKLQWAITIGSGDRHTKKNQKPKKRNRIKIIIIINHPSQRIIHPDALIRPLSLKKMRNPNPHGGPRADARRGDDQRWEANFLLESFE